MPRFLLATWMMLMLAARLLAQSSTPAPAVPQTASKSPALPSPSQSPSAKPTTEQLVNSLNPADLQAVIALLKSNFTNPDAITDTELNRATIQGLMVRLPHGVMLLPNRESAAMEAPIAFYSEILDGHIGYLRLGSLNSANLQALDKSLSSFATKKVDALVIDLRASQATNDFATASEFAKRFCPKGKPLFTLRKTTVRQERSFISDREPSYQGLIIILADGDTAGASEAIAGVVRLYDKALIIGQQTAGRAVEYSDLRLPSGKVLRVAVGEAVLPEGVPLFPGGLKPDVPVEMAGVDKREIFQQSLEKGMTPFVVENARPHLNEAALISGKNPELEAMELAQKKNRNPDKLAMHNPVLQRALDLVTSLAVFNGDKK